MTRVRSRIISAAAGGLVLLSTSGLAQRQPNFSGQWELVEALASGPGRDGTASDQPRRTTSTTISGAPFNCGRGCTIVHKGQTLTVARAQLAGAEPSAVPSITLQLDGRETKIVDSFNPPSELSVIARWQGGGLEVETRSGGPLRQTLTIDKNELLVATTNERQGTGTTFRYRKK